MLRWTWKILLAMICIVPATHSLAAPIFMYGFTVDTCVAIEGGAGTPGSACFAGAVESLETSFISITHGAAQARRASFYYSQPTLLSPGQPVLVNDGVVQLSLPNPGSLGNFIYPHGRCGYSCDVDIDVVLGPGVSSFLSGNITGNWISDNLRMTGAAGIWSGYVQSDNQRYGGSFTGSWNLVRVISEPDALGLALVALGVLSAVAARRRVRFWGVLGTRCTRNI